MELFWPCGYKGGHLFQVLILISTLILECILIASPLNLLPISILVAWIHPHLPPLLQRVLISIASLGIRLILPPANLTAPYKPANLVAPIILASLTAPEIPNKLTAPENPDNLTAPHLLTNLAAEALPANPRSQIFLTTRNESR